MPAGTILLYGQVSNWIWQRAPIAAATNPQDKRAQDIAATVAMLERRLRAKSDDIDAWLMLGKSYLAIADADSAVRAFTQAHQLSGGKNATAVLSLGWALSLREGGRITSEANQLFETAIVLAPHDPRALLYGGLAAAQRGDVVSARRRWMELKGMHPTPKVAAMLDARLADLDRQASAGSDQRAAAPAQVNVSLALAPRLAARVSSDTLLPPRPVCLFRDADASDRSMTFLTFSGFE